MSDEQILNIVDEQDNIIGTETRDTIHKLGLRHRESHVYFLTPQREIIFQLRSKDKDTFPNLLDATVGGHVEVGDSYEATAIKETLEETGWHISASELRLIAVIKRDSHDVVTGKSNNFYRAIFGYLFHGRIEDLKIETGEAVGFEAWSIEKLQNLTEEERGRFIPLLVETDSINMYKEIEERLI